MDQLLYESARSGWRCKSHCVIGSMFKITSFVTLNCAKILKKLYIGVLETIIIPTIYTSTRNIQNQSINFIPNAMPLRIVIITSIQNTLNLFIQCMLHTSSEYFYDRTNSFGYDRNINSNYKGDNCKIHRTKAQHKRECMHTLRMRRGQYYGTQ